MLGKKYKLAFWEFVKKFTNNIGLYFYWKGDKWKENVAKFIDEVNKLK